MTHGSLMRPVAERGGTPVPQNLTGPVCSRWTGHPCPQTVGLRRFTNGHFCPNHAPRGGHYAPDPNPLKSAALVYAARGWHVFPLVPGQKRPAVSDWENRATTNRARIDRCWDHAAYNVGIATGPSGLVVVDLDVPKNGEEPKEPWSSRNVACGADVLAVIADEHQAAYPHGTFTVSTPSRGTHLYFAAPAGAELRNTCGSLGWKVDTRAHGGYVVAAGSTVDRTPYTVVPDCDPAPAPLPAWLAELLLPKPLPPQKPVVLTLPNDRRGAYVNAAVNAQVGYVLKSGDDEHNTALYRSACALGQLVAGGALAEQQAMTALANAAAQVGQGSREAERTIRSGLKAGAKRPRSVAA
ncbi:bifunctional DNA primase/polymerase [Yinghuangia seranimata]|uniref:bifunctional DNA primase/polymerase n=1 Tax=Yinghuangia seranimata TaxID=408067 RepID=UPI00248C3DAC|nr:bifunctional DNA primase/polymerase [Yinghuangia seranimata]MDI2126950.1 bifunctional DNA primase/polymerase [Yinghuangia seranimata]